MAVHFKLILYTDDSIIMVSDKDPRVIVINNVPNQII